MFLKGERIMKLISTVSMFLLLLASAVFAAQPNWQNICPKDNVSYCKNIGKNAHNNSTNLPVLRGIKLGKIIGVSWRPKGSVIGISEAIPSAGIPESVRKSSRNAYYYIINDGSGKLFLRQCREIETK
jgi:hypothetical protein